MKYKVILKLGYSFLVQQHWQNKNLNILASVGVQRTNILAMISNSVDTVILKQLDMKVHMTIILIKL